MNDSSLSRPWSAHSVGSSRYEKKHQQSQQQKPNNKSLGDTSKVNKDQKKLKSKIAVGDKNNEKLQEFLEVMQPRSKSKTWTNDDLTILDSHWKKFELGNESKSMKKKDAKIGESDDDELYQDLSKKDDKKKKDLAKSTNNNNNNNSKSETSSSESEDEEEQDVDMTKDLISDMDWLKLRMNKKLDLEDEEEVSYYLTEEYIFT